MRKHRMTMIKLITSLFIWLGGAALVFWHSKWQVLVGVMLMMWANNISINHRMDNRK
jgi:hypothetical protein